MTFFNKKIFIIKIILFLKSSKYQKCSRTRARPYHIDGDVVRINSRISSTYTNGCKTSQIAKRLFTNSVRHVSPYDTRDKRYKSRCQQGVRSALKE